MNKAFNATVAGQKAMCSMASRIATLHLLNEAIRKMKPSEAYDRSVIDHLSSIEIDGMRDSLIVDYNRLLKTRGTHD